MSDDPPGKSLAESPAENLANHFIPQDRALWSLSNYERFCEERETLIANGIKHLLRSLGIEDNGTLPKVPEN
jgi:hypothetical protein